MDNALLEELNSIATRMVDSGKGILAADESTGTIKKRFDTIGLESTEDNRRDYRELLFRTESAMKENISGVILFDETIRQKAADGTPLVDLIADAGSIPGIKVDMGAKDLAFHDGEKVTEGLTGLRERLEEYHQLGARFAKWRAVIDIGRGGDRSMPSYSCLRANMHALARYAALCQEQRIVPIVEPEVLMDGDHDIDRCYEVTELGLKLLYEELYYAKVALEGTILKPNMVIAGKKAGKQASTEEIAEKTVKCFRHAVPAAVPGIVFLSGGQSEVQATENLNEMNRHYADVMPWKLSYSYGRALQASAIETWGGKSGNVEAAQKAFAHRAKMNGLAQQGAWTKEMENAS
ncbi:fructose-bisphosphate aldolase class I [Parvularcula sp. ZS-1/3]|uniref:Fructose-bisphosphate aldolase n=1 Tax=Parvularcula mediterranea TaxID=2732508 RepID=A0A7Y3RL14_9PROT|nr:class I fructose-bisphosphate aldolase [Parvularcula mediterranea]NNU16037.1 fructose-bisphosphate aldolase class I [Parvularcula mediterranea]